MPIKSKLTKKQKHVIEKMRSVNLARGHEDDGSTVYFFMDGSRAPTKTVKSLIERGVIDIEQCAILGAGQMLMLVE